MSEKYVEEHPDEVFKTKTELAAEILKDKFQAYEDKILKNKVTLLTDASYAVKRVLGPAREMGLNYVGRLKKDRQIRLISRWMRVDKYFDEYKKERYFTHEGVKVFYKEAVLDVKELGRTKVFRLREESEAEYKYYVASKMNMTAKTCYRYKKSRWSIEDMHRDGKQYCGMKNICAWKKDPLIAHYSFVFFLWWLFERFRVEQGLKVSFESLWWEYCAGIDRAKMQRMQLAEPPPIAALFNYV